MKKLKQFIKLATAMFALGLVFSFCITSQAAERQKGVVYVNPLNNISVLKMRMEENSFSNFYVYFAEKGDYIADVKTSKKNLNAEVTNQTNSSDSGHATITLYSAKEGNYTLSFSVRKSDGSVRGTYKMKIYCTKNSFVYNKIMLDKTTIYQSQTKKSGNTTTRTIKSNYKISSGLKSAKLKVTPNKGYTITGITVVSVDKNGNYSYKTVKNGKKINFSQKYAYESRSAGSDKTRSAKKITYVYISYKDKYLGSSVKYSITKTHGVKEIKKVTKRVNGQTSTSYSKVPAADVKLSAY